MQRLGTPPALGRASNECVQPFVSSSLISAGPAMCWRNAQHCCCRLRAIHSAGGVANDNRPGAPKGCSLPRVMDTAVHGLAGALYLIGSLCHAGHCALLLTAAGISLRTMECLHVLGYMRPQQWVSAGSPLSRLAHPPKASNRIACRRSSRESQGTLLPTPWAPTSDTTQVTASTESQQATANVIKLTRTRGKTWTNIVN